MRFDFNRANWNKKIFQSTNMPLRTIYVYNNQRMIHLIIFQMEPLNCIIYFYNRFLVILVFLQIVTQKLMQSLKLRGITISNPFSGHLCYSSGKLQKKLKYKYFIREIDYNHSGQFSISVLVLCMVHRSLVLYLLFWICIFRGFR